MFNGLATEIQRALISPAPVLCDCHGTMNYGLHFKRWKTKNTALRDKFDGNFRSHLNVFYTFDKVLVCAIYN